MGYNTHAVCLNCLGALASLQQDQQRREREEEERRRREEEERRRRRREEEERQRRQEQERKRKEEEQRQREAREKHNLESRLRALFSLFKGNSSDIPSLTSSFTDQLVNEITDAHRDYVEEWITFSSLSEAFNRSSAHSICGVLEEPSNDWILSLSNTLRDIDSDMQEYLSNVGSREVDDYKRSLLSAKIESMLSMLDLDSLQSTITTLSNTEKSASVILSFFHTSDSSDQNEERKERDEDLFSASSVTLDSIVSSMEEIVHQEHVILNLIEQEKMELDASCQDSRLSSLFHFSDFGCKLKAPFSTHDFSQKNVILDFLEQRVRFLTGQDKDDHLYLLLSLSNLTNQIRMLSVSADGLDIQMEQIRKLKDDIEAISAFDSRFEEIKAREQHLRRTKRDLRRLAIDMEDAKDENNPDEVYRIEQAIQALSEEVGQFDLRNHAKEKEKLHNLVFKHAPYILDEHEDARSMLCIQENFEDMPLSIFDPNQKLHSYRNRSLIPVTSRHPVYKALRRDTGEKVVLKEYSVSDPDSKRHFSRQVKLIDQANHPNMSKIQCVFLDGEKVYTESKFYPGGNLLHWLSRNTRTDEEKKIILCDVLTAVSYLHRNSIIHCDIKPDNIFVNEHGRGILGDFDGSRELGASTFTVSLAAEGTMRYLPPEVVESTRSTGHVAFTSSWDMFSIGMTVRDVFSEETKDREERDKLRDFASSLTNPDPSRRMDAESALEHAFLKSTVKSLANPVRYMRHETRSLSTPLYWSMRRCENGRFDKVSLSRDGKQWRQIDDFLSSNWDSQFIGRGRDGGGLRHKRFRLTRIWRVENGSMWKRYASARDVMEPSRGRPPFVNSVNNAELEREIGLDRTKREVLLFHGTTCGQGGTPDIVSMIARQGFDERLANPSGMFGAGIYFANRASKSDSYAGDGSTSRCQMILTRVLMGNAFVTKTSMNNFKRPPCTQNCSGNCGHARYDSVWFDGTNKNYEEYIIFDRYRCYPEFIVEYERV